MHASFWGPVSAPVPRAAVWDAPAAPHCHVSGDSRSPFPGSATAQWGASGEEAGDGAPSWLGRFGAFSQGGHPCPGLCSPCAPLSQSVLPLWPPSWTVPPIPGCALHPRLCPRSQAVPPITACTPILGCSPFVPSTPGRAPHPGPSPPALPVGGGSRGCMSGSARGPGEAAEGAGEPREAQPGTGHGRAGRTGGGGGRPGAGRGRSPPHPPQPPPPPSFPAARLRGSATRRRRRLQTGDGGGAAQVGPTPTPAPRQGGGDPAAGAAGAGGEPGWARWAQGEGDERGRIPPGRYRPCREHPRGCGAEEPGAGVALLPPASIPPLGCRWPVALGWNRGRILPPEGGGRQRGGRRLPLRPRKKKRLPGWRRVGGPGTPRGDGVGSRVPREKRGRGMLGAGVGAGWGRGQPGGRWSRGREIGGTPSAARPVPPRPQRSLLWPPWWGRGGLDESPSGWGAPLGCRGRAWGVGVSEPFSPLRPLLPAEPWPTGD